MAKKLFALETNTSNYLKYPKVLTYYKMIVKNQISKFEKKFKIIKNILRVIDLELLYKGEIYENIKLISI